MRNALPSTLSVLLAAPALSAHPGDHGTSLAAGLAHPLQGIDHLLAMVAVGLLAVRCGARGDARAWWLIPATFLGAMAVGGALALSGLQLPAVEWGIALSLLVFGVLVALAHTPTTWVAATVVGAFAVLHGQAHVNEYAGAHLPSYFGGFLLSTTFLHITGLAVGIWVAKTWNQLPVRFAGGTIAACSLFATAALVPA